RTGALFNFDPSVTVPYAVPAMFLILVFAFVWVLVAGQSRAGTAITAALAFAGGLVATLLTDWARFTHYDSFSSPFDIINLAVSFTGASQFQGFVLTFDERVDHPALAELAALFASGLLVTMWSRVGAAGEAGIPRQHRLFIALFIGAVG